MIKKKDLPFLKWKKSFKKKFRILKIRKLFEISRNQHNVARGYDIEFLLDKKNKIKRYLIVQGLSVQIVPLIFCTTNKSYYTIMVKQIRIGSEKQIPEFPSGAMGYNDKNFREAAKREIQEELKLNISLNKILKLSSQPVIMQPVNSYLKCQFFYFKLNMSLKNLNKLNDIKTGIENQNEFCISKVIKLKKVLNMMNDSSLIGIKLLEKKLNISIKDL